MLLSILDLEHVTVNDIMIPRQDIASINVDDNWEDILDQLRQTPHTRLPLYEGDLDNLVGIVHMKRVAQELARDTLTRERLIELARTREPYFVPEGTSLTVQLNQFQRNRRRMAFVVDEYGDIQGFVTLEDILEEIVGEFTTDPATVTHKHVHREAPGVFIVNASATVRALNRSLGWQLPTDGPKTLNGLLVEQLETLPEAGDRVEVGEYQFEVLQIGENTIRTVRARRAAAATRNRRRPQSSVQPSATFSASSSRVNSRTAQPFDGRPRRVVLRDQRRRESLLGRLAQPLFAVGHGPQFARQADLAEGHQVLRDGFVRQARRQRQRHRQIAGGFRDLEPAHQVHEHVVLLQRDAGVPVHDGQQHGDALRIEPLRHAPRRAETHAIDEPLQLDQQRPAAIARDRDDAARRRRGRARQEDRRRIAHLAQALLRPCGRTPARPPSRTGSWWRARCGNGWTHRFRNTAPCRPGVRARADRRWRRPWSRGRR